MKKIITYAIWILVLFLFQTSFFTHFRLADVVPNLLIILTASIAIINGSFEGCITGFICGLLLDLTSANGYFLTYALGFLVIGYFIGISNRAFYKEELTFPILMIAISDFLYGIYMYVTGYLIRGRLDFLFYLRRIILPEMVYTIIIAIFLYKLILLITERFLIKGSEKFIA